MYLPFNLATHRPKTNKVRPLAGQAQAGSGRVRELPESAEKFGEGAITENEGAPVKGSYPPSNGLAHAGLDPRHPCDDLDLTAYLTRAYGVCREGPRYPDERAGNAGPKCFQTWVKPAPRLTERAG